MSVLPLTATAARFEVKSSGEGKQVAYLLRDTKTGAQARICPGMGDQCTHLALPAPDSKLREILSSPTTPDGMPSASGAANGIPILFPWPGMIPAGVYEFQGKRYQLPTIGKLKPVAMHGFVQGRSFKVESAQGDEKAARLVCSIDAAACPDVQTGYPFSWTLRITHELNPWGLTLSAEVTNSGTGPMPFGLGLHPWFRLPLGEQGQRLEDCLAEIPSKRMWDMTLLDSLSLDPKAGQKSALPAASAAWKLDVPAEQSLFPARPITERQTVLFTDLALKDGMSECRLIDPKARAEVALQCVPDFTTMVVFKPRGQSSLCIEPWTCPPNGFNLAARGVEENGVKVLKAGERWQGAVRIMLRPAQEGAVKAK